MTIIEANEDNIMIPDQGPGLPRPKYKGINNGGSPGNKSQQSSTIRAQGKSKISTIKQRY